MGGITTIINKVKYVGIACLSLAILSTLILNIISSYSSSKVNSNAEPLAEVSTSANEACDPSNTNAASCISLSITSSSSSTSTGGDDANLSLQIPREGGIATGRHTVTVNSNNYTGYYVTLTGNAGSPAMTPTTSTSQAFIQSTTGTLTNPSSLDKGQWGSWGIALPNSSLYTGFNTNEADYNSTNQDTLAKTTWAAVPGKEADDGSKTIIKTTTQSRKTDAYPVYYGVRVDSPVSVPADTYTAQVVYTATTNEVPMPTITSTSSNTYELGSGAGGTVTITGTNLASTYKVYIESNTDSTKQYDITNTITNLTDTGLTVTIPTDQTNPGLEAGDYTIHVVTQGGEESVGFTIYISYSVYDPDDNVRVDWDGVMIPVVYDSASQTWKSLASSDASSTTGWFDYYNKRWANAVTVKADKLSVYQNKSDIEVKEDDVLGYWVYIPRYAYKVMRKDSTDRYVNAQNFEIKFETTDYSAKHIPKTSCNANATSASAMWRDGNRNNDVLSNIKVGYYQNCAGMNNSYFFGSPGSVISTTSWATHPAFTFGDQELNGLWVGKFELTGSTSQPTILPNQKHLAQDIVTLYDVAKSMGQEDKDNTGGGNTNVRKNNQNLTIASTRMVNNSDWGAITYLAASKYGAGYDGVQQNTQEQSGLDGDNNSSTGVTGCGPVSQNSVDTYSNGGKLGTNLACSSSDSRYAYNGSIGVTASTTGNVYGVYDMSGGAWEYTAANTTTSDEHTTSVSDVQFAVALSEPYANLYRTSDGFDGARPAWWNTRTNYSEDCWNRDVCSWSTCGGQALHEVSNFQTNNNFLYGTWIGNDHYETGDHGPNGNDAAFPSLTEGRPWFIRGECAGWSADTNMYGEPGYVGGEMFSFNYDSGAALDTYGTRVVLMLNYDMISYDLDYW